MAIVGIGADELFDALYRQENFRGYTFEAHGDVEAVKKTDVGQVSQRTLLDAPTRAPMIAGRGNTGHRGRPRLQTLLDCEKLEKRLTKIYREARTLEEEQGISTLYLALGFLKWFDSDQSEEPSLAPLILLPVSLDRGQERGGYVLSGREDDIVVNVSLHGRS